MDSEAEGVSQGDPQGDSRYLVINKPPDQVLCDKDDVLLKDSDLTEETAGVVREDNTPPLALLTFVPNLNSSCVDNNSSSEDHEDDHAGPLRDLPKTTTNSSTYDRQKQDGRSPVPGVILLGRGNSFCHGRSEVIVLNNRRRGAHNKVSEKNRLNGSVTPTRTAPQSGVLELSNGHVTLDTQFDSHHSQSPPPISNDRDSEDDTMTTTGSTADDSNKFVVFPDQDLDSLWRKAEAIMMAKQGAVQKVLEDFGIGEAGGGEDDEDRVIEEENVWQVVQENFQV